MGHSWETGFLIGAAGQGAAVFATPGTNTGLLAGAANGGASTDTRGSVFAAGTDGEGTDGILGLGLWIGLGVEPVRSMTICESIL